MPKKGRYSEKTIRVDIQQNKKEKNKIGAIFQKEKKVA